jgi:hypothetical protein
METIWVAIREGFGFACIVDDGTPADRKDVKAFFRRNAGFEIRKCNRDESIALMEKHPKVIAARAARYTPEATGRDE